MLFNSIDFAVFLPIVFALYWFVCNKSIKLQNTLVLIASYVFYGWWDWRFLSLILFSTLVDYCIGLAIHSSTEQKRKKILLSISLLINLGFLGFFKYYNFFVESFIDAFSFFGSEIKPNTLHIILPVGISFYTFQTLSYTIDVYRGKLKPTKDIVAFGAFVSFFPQLVAGPIERATKLLPQFYKKRTFDYNLAVIGMRQILWGLFKKIVIADNCAQYANEIFNDYGSQSGSTLFLGALFFTFQIYGDFSGYSDIAIGVSRLFGFDLIKNFAFPYFSRDIAEFWRRWHISLSTWFRDYLYIPLGGSKGSTSKKIRNVFIIFLVSGFWHGANWTFVVWGGLNALYFLPIMLRDKNRKHMEVVAVQSLLPSIKETIQMLSTFIMTVFAWIFFRSDNIASAIDYITILCSKSLLSMPDIKSKSILLLIIFFIVIEWLGRRNEFAIEKMQVQQPLRWVFYFFIILLIVFYNGNEQEFIYFQF